MTLITLIFKRHLAQSIMRSSVVNLTGTVYQGLNSIGLSRICPIASKAAF